MDTNIADRDEIQVEDGAEPLSRVHDDVGEAHRRAFSTFGPSERVAAGPKASPPARKRRRNGLMVGGCSVVVLATAAGMFWISPYNRYTLHGVTNLATHVRNVALNSLPRPAPLIAPAAQLAQRARSSSITASLSAAAIWATIGCGRRRHGGVPATWWTGGVAPVCRCAALSTFCAIKTFSQTHAHVVSPQRATIPVTMIAPAPSPSEHPALPVGATVKPTISTHPAPLASKPTALAPAPPLDAVAKIAELRPPP